MNGKELLKITGIPVFIASLCCLSPIVIVIFGFVSVEFATSLADTLYGSYKWYFRIAGLVSMIVAVVLYFRKSKNICTFNAVKRNVNVIINTVLIVFITGILGYILFLYVVVHYWGVWLHIWE